MVGVPADDPDETTGTAWGVGEPGRHRPGPGRAATRPPAVDGSADRPAVEDHRDDPSRHGRTGATSPGNARDGRRGDEQNDADPFGDWYGGGAPDPAEQHPGDRAEADRPDGYDAADVAGPSTGSWPYESPDADDAAATRSRDPRTHGSDPGGPQPHHAGPHGVRPDDPDAYGASAADPGYPDEPWGGRAPHRSDRYAPDPRPTGGYAAERGDAQRYADHPGSRPAVGRLGAGPGGTDPHAVAPHPGADHPGPDPADERAADERAGGPWWTDERPAAQVRDDPYAATPYATRPPVHHDGTATDATEPAGHRSPDTPGPDRTPAPHPADEGVHRGRAGTDGAGPPDDRYGDSPYGEALFGDSLFGGHHGAARPAADPAPSWGSADHDPSADAGSHAAGVDATGGFDLRARRRIPDPGPPTSPGMPVRRPGDPPGVPAELFVETTMETPALRFDDEPAEPAESAEPAEPEEAPEPAPRGPWWRSWVQRSSRSRSDNAPDSGVGGHGHGHGHTPARPAGRRVRILIAALLVPCALATLVGVVLLWPTGGPPGTAQASAQQPVQAQVTAARATDCTPGSGDGGCVALVVHMADGPLPGRDLVQVVPIEPGSPQFAIGDQVVLGWSGADPQDAGSYQIVDFQRGAPLAWLAGLFAAAVLLLGRWRGLAALAALVLSFGVLLLFVLPSILAGNDPLAVAVVGSCLIMFVVLYLTHGPSARTSTAVLGTLASLALIGALGAVFSAAAQLTGLDDQTSNLIASLGTGVDARGLLLAGVVIGALGVLDDVTVTQTSAVWELRAANPTMGARRLFTAAMRIGRDHVASAVNTLVLAYAGAALPLLLLFSLSGQGFGAVVTAQDVATEVVRTLVGSIGLVASVPITTALAAAVAVREKAPEGQDAPA
jgi:uncharacterized membrane protein